MSTLRERGAMVDPKVEDWIRGRRTFELLKLNEELKREIGDLKRSEEMLRVRTESLERSNKELEEFAYVAAHDLREPLVGIAAYLKVLEGRCKNRLDSKARKLLSRAMSITLRMDSFVQSLLAYSRPRTAPNSLRRVDCNVALKSALSDLKYAMDAVGATVTSEPLPTIMGDPRLMVQLFQNLVGNAIKFAGDRPLTIHVGATRKGSKWQFSVKDNGIGIEPPHFERIFKIFQRLEGSGGPAGANIGLASSKKIVERMGGRIWIESVPDKGSIFFFTIPQRGNPDPPGGLY